MLPVNRVVFVVVELTLIDGVTDWLFEGSGDAEIERVTDDEREPLILIDIERVTDDEREPLILIDIERVTDDEREPLILVDIVRVTFVDMEPVVLIDMVRVVRADTLVDGVIVDITWSVQHNICVVESVVELYIQPYN